PYARRTNSITARLLYILFAQSSEFEGRQTLPRKVLCHRGGAVALGLRLPPQRLARRRCPILRLFISLRVAIIGSLEIAEGDDKASPAIDKAELQEVVFEKRPQSVS